ncbi:MAG: hypothetical protein WBA17_02440 [Saprospiraceae bacterium]
MQTRPLLLLVCLLLAGTAAAQYVQTNVYLFAMEPAGDTSYNLVQPRFLSDFNSTGYNNQPVFIDNKTLFMTVRKPDMQEPDLYAFDLAKRTQSRVTATPAGEFSPAPSPDYRSFSAVRMEVVGADTALRIWQFPLDRTTNGRPVFKYLTNVGYYAWVSSRQMAVYVVGPNPTLALANSDTDELQTIAQNPGRCFSRLPSGNLAYVEKPEFGPWRIMEKNLYRLDTEALPVVNCLPGAEDFAVLRDGTFLMGQGSKIFQYNRLRHQGWVELADLRFYNINNITRLAVSDDYQIAVVGD